MKRVATVAWLAAMLGLPAAGFGLLGILRLPPRGGGTRAVGNVGT
jgi:hypothetical protein